MKARRLFRAILRAGWVEEHRKGSHITMSRKDHESQVWGFHESDEIPGYRIRALFRIWAIDPDDV